MKSSVIVEKETKRKRWRKEGGVTFQLDHRAHFTCKRRTTHELMATPTHTLPAC